MNEPHSVNVKLGGALVEYAPADQSGTKHVLQLNSETSVQDILDQLGVPTEQPLLVILNDTMIARPDYPSTFLANKDQLALVPPITAG